MTDKVKILLHPRVLGGNINPARERLFMPVPTGDPQEPAYHARYFETMPTTWAVAYTFQRAIERQDRTALEQWLTLFLLDFYGYIHLKPYEQTTLQQDYDRDLWPALSGTYPRPNGDALTSVMLLHTSSRAETVVGGYYPGIFFFPSRGRSRWEHDETLSPYLEGQSLSWRRSAEVLLRDNRAKQEFFRRLRSLAEKLEQKARAALYGFITQEPLFKGLSTTGTVEQLSDNPLDWRRPHKEEGPDPDDPESKREYEAKLKKRLLDTYPLQQVRNGVTTYYLVAGWPVVADWMNTGVESGLPPPNQYEKVSDTVLRVQQGPQLHTFNLGEQGRVVLLTDLMLDKAPYFCAVNKAESEKQAGQIRRLHKQEIGNPAGDFKFLKVDDHAVCLAPLRAALLGHFPELLREPERYVTPRVENDMIHWGLTLLGRQLSWPTMPKYKPLQESSVALWPPEMSAEWHLYVAMAMGADKSTYGRWYLVDEQGCPGGKVDTSEGEYLNILPDPEKPVHDKPNRPLALLLRDTNAHERGVLFLVRLEDKTAEKSADLAMDFGTSNSCLAYSVNNGEPKPLVFDLSPKMLWGKEPALENPGVVPFKWGGKKGYFPTILLSRVGANFKGVQAGNLQPQHLFSVDIPGLHKDMEMRVFDGMLGKDTLGKEWMPHFDLKWESDAEHPWRRAAFLGLALLYAHAELFFRFQATIKRCVFTFPLAFTKTKWEGFHGEARQVAERVREHCYRQPVVLKYFYNVNESIAVAQAVDSTANEGLLEVFVDIGGGTTDLAIRHNGHYPVLDSIKLAGKSFFDFAVRNFRATPEVASSQEFRGHLGRLLFDSDEKTATESIQMYLDKNLNLGDVYSLAINRLDDGQFRRKETAVLEQRMGWPSYQLYRTRLFFRHILTYALLQACAVVADKQLAPETLSSGIKLILSGNGWGLLLFAETPRERNRLKNECQYILDLLKDRLLRGYDPQSADEKLQRERACLERLRIFDVNLLNEGELSEAKTKVPKGALRDLDQQDATASYNAWKRAYLGVTLPKVHINSREAISLRWCDLWGDEHLKELLKERLNLKMKVQDLESLEISAPASYQSPFDHTLEVFTSLGGSGDNDPLPPEEWQNINSKLGRGTVYIKGNRLTDSPINYFVSQILYPANAEHFYLDRLAAINKTIR